MLTFQEIITKLQEYWIEQGCVLSQSHDVETGAGTFNPETFLRCLGPEPYNVCHVEISKRPTDGRYGQNPNRLQKFHQFQVIMKPSPPNIQELYLQSLEAIGFKLKKHDIRFVHDDWESPTQGAWGLGWEVWCDGMEITQFTYFQCVGGEEVKPVAAEIAFGLERLTMFLQGVSNVYDIQYNDHLTYGEVYLESEKQWSHYNFEEASIEMWQRHFEDFELEANKLLSKGYPVPAYDFAIKASHAFNMMDARGAISTTARVGLMHRIRDLCCAVAKAYIADREKLGYPLLKGDSYGKALPQPKLPHHNFNADNKDDLILEIGSEELPAAFIPGALIALERAMNELLKNKGLAFEKLSVYGSPRRLAVLVEGLVEGSHDQTSERKGPAVAIAFDSEGNATAQGLGFFQSAGLEPATLDEIEKGERADLRIQEGKYLFASILKKGASTISIMHESLPHLITHLPFPKSMRWGNFDITYARPIRWILALYGKDLIPFAVADVLSSDTTRGHAQISPGSVTLSHPKKYLTKLAQHDVLVDLATRSAHIEKQIAKIEESTGFKVTQKERVLSEVLYLSEYPTLAICSFDDKFLSLPDELLISEMISHQRYFPLINEHGTIVPTFIVAVDKEPNETILKNNRAVLTARLSDGLFLYQQDHKKSLADMNEGLKRVVFHKDLGSVYDKVQRLTTLSSKIAGLLNQTPPTRAAELSKADLTSAVVCEFPELQGIIGKYYAIEQGESEETATAIEEHWRPLTEGAALPSTDAGAILALADKLDNLISYTSIGLKPSSSKDPYALRRAAISILRILIEKQWALDLRSIIDSKELREFILQRLHGILLDYDLTKEEIEAALSSDSQDPYDIYCRASALHNLRTTTDAFDSFRAVYKRVKGQIATETPKTFNNNFLKEPAEIALSHLLDKITPELSLAQDRRDYLAAFTTLSTLSSPLADFFDNVRVLADDPQLQANRIALLQRLDALTTPLINLSALSA